MGHDGSDGGVESLPHAHHDTSPASVVGANRDPDAIGASLALVLLGVVVTVAWIQSGSGQAALLAGVVAGAALVVTGAYNAVRQAIDVAPSVGASLVGVSAGGMLVVSAGAADGGVFVLVGGVVAVVLVLITARNARPRRIEGDVGGDT